MNTFRSIKAWAGIGRLIGLTLAWGSTGTALAQAPPAGDVRIAVREDDRSVLLYHTVPAPIEHGFHVYRRDTDEGQFEQLTAFPIRSVRSGAELRDYLGTLYGEIEDATGQSDANSTLAKVRSDSRVANLLTFLYPKMADALGRRFVDRTAPIETVVTYRLEFVDAWDRPTGTRLEQTLLLLPGRPDAPVSLRAINDGRTVTLYWRYIPPNLRTDDRVVRFEAFRIDPATNTPVRLHDQILLRNNALYEYALSFEVPTTGQTERFFVQAVDLSGQAGVPSTELRYEVVDRQAPSPVEGVSASTLAEGRVRIEWKAAEGVRGYHVYRAGRVFPNAAYSRLTEAPLSSEKTVFVDSLPAGAAFYRVAALDERGNESGWSPAAIALVRDETPPERPRSLLARYDEATATIDLKWEAPADDASSFLVLRRRLGDPSEGNVRLHADTLSEATYRDPGEAGGGFREGSVYRYTVIALDAAQNRSEPAWATIRIPDRIPPEAPGALIAATRDGRHVALAWNPSPSPDLAAYVVYRQNEGETALHTRVVAASTHQYEDSEVAAGQNYTYWVTAADSAGNESARSERRQLVLRDGNPPRSVRNVRASADSAGVVLTWEPVPAFNLAGYRIYRANTATGSYEALNELPIVGQTWTDPTGAAGQWYRVRAVDTSNQESLPGEPSCALPPHEP
jgi:hypothetical protein